MTVISDDTRREDYVASAAQTIFPFSFEIMESADLDVYIDNVLQSEGTDYVVTGSGGLPAVDAAAIGPFAGNVTLTSAAIGAEVILLNGDRPIARDSDFATGQTTLLASELNASLSALTVMMQERERDITRCLRVPLPDVNPNFLLGAAAARAGKYLRFADPSGDAELAEITASTTILSQSIIGGFLWPQTIAEQAANVIPVNLFVSPGKVSRYGTNLIPGTTDMSVAIQAAIDQQNQGGPGVDLGEGTYAYGTTLIVYSGTSIKGVNPTESQLRYTGAAEGIVQSTPSVRIFDLVFRDFYLRDTGTGTIGFDMSAVSTSSFENLLVSGWGTGFKLTSPTSGYSVYNRLNNCFAQSCTTGFHLLGTSTNANVLFGCRADSTTSVLIEDSNDNTLLACQFESGQDGVVLTASSAGLTDRNRIIDCRFESNTGDDINIGVDCRATMIRGVYFAGGATVVDNGTRTDWGQNSGNVPQQTFFPFASAAGCFRWERTVVATGIPMAIFEDSGVGSGSPITVQINASRDIGTALEINNDGVQSFSVRTDGRINSNQAAANVNTPSGATASQMPIYDESGTLIGYIPIYAAPW